MIIPFDLNYEKYKWVARLNGRSESDRAGVRAWIQAQPVPALSTRVAGLLDLFAHL